MLRLAGERRRLEACGHARLHEARFDRHDGEPVGMVLVIETLEIASEARLGSPIEDDRLAAALTGNGAEDAKRPSAFSKKRLLRGLAKKHGVGEVDA